jgi:RNA polymerase sigma-70 factor (ECF subfamily)
MPDPDLARQRVVVDAFLTAARAGDMHALLEVLDPDVVFRTDVGLSAGGGAAPVVGAPAVATRILATAPRFARQVKPALVNGQAGAVFVPAGRVAAVLGFTVVAGRIASIDLIADPDKLRRIADF